MYVIMIMKDGMVWFGLVCVLERSWGICLSFFFPSGFCICTVLLYFS